MIPGYNESVRSGERLFHIQTEDLGTTKALVVSQVFHEGRILHTSRADYREKLDQPNMEREVRKLLMRQHRDMHRLIQQGALLTKLEPGSESRSATGEPTRPPVAAGAGAASGNALLPSPPASAPAAAVSPASPAGEVPSPALPAAATSSGPPAAVASSASPAAVVSPASPAAAASPAPPAAPAAPAPPASAPAATSPASPADGFLADLISDRRLDLVFLLELVRLAEAEGESPGPPRTGVGVAGPPAAT
ncbi:MAG: hypothetical protein RBU45_00185 [Myxococcota bacterium]|jgi:hypothetical protein|nr:hypothetical protein [Myxococcota bacterium]